MEKKAHLSPIMKEVFLQLFHRPATRNYPQAKPLIPAGFRGRVVFDVTQCMSCGLCARDCPARAIEMVDVEGKKRPEFHIDRCIFCSLCSENCPRHAIVPSHVYELASIDKNALILKP